MGLCNNCELAVHNYPQNVHNTIFVANYPASFVEYLILPIVSRDREIRTTIVTSRDAGVWARMFVDSESILSLGASSANYLQLQEAIISACNNNIVPIVYPERKFWYRKNVHTLQEFRSGIFKIARENKLTIVLVYVQHIDHWMGYMRNKHIHIIFEQCNVLDAAQARNQMLHMYSYESSQPVK